MRLSTKSRFAVAAMSGAVQFEAQVDNARVGPRRHREPR